jgi:alkyl hydroperoxide reductase subunit AhpC
MTLRLGDTAPDFQAETTNGPIHFHEWLGDAWGVLFSHPRDFTPVCTTELGYVARLHPEFERRGVRAIGLSVDPVASHKGWAADIQETQGYAVNFPIIADPDRKVAGLYGMIHPAHDEVYTVRTVFDPAGDRLAPAHRSASGGHPGQLEAGRGRDHRARGFRRGGAGQVPGRLARAEAVPASHPGARP